MSIGISEIREKQAERDRIERETREYLERGGRIDRVAADRSQWTDRDYWRRMGEVTYRNREQIKRDKARKIRPARRG